MQASLYDAVTQVHELNNNVVCEDRCALEILGKEFVVETRNSIRVIQRHNASHMTGSAGPLCNKVESTDLEAKATKP